MEKIKNYLYNLTDEKQPDYLLFYISSVLILVGIIFSYSLSVYTVVHLDYNQYHFLLRQLIAGILSIFVMWTFAQIKPEKLLPFVGWSLFGIFLIAIFSMKILPASMIIESGGASRWIRLPGISLSPVEFFKIGFIYYLAHSLTRRVYFVTNISFLKELLLVLSYAIIFLILAYFIAVVQKDLGQTVVIGCIIFVLLFFANRSFKLILFILTLAFFGIITLIALFPHRVSRIQSWWGMVQDNILPYLPTFLSEQLKLENYTEAYQVGHSINAIHNGSFVGEGLSNGYLKLGFLSEVHTDFVLAGITEEIGIVGISIIVILFSILINRIFQLSRMIHTVTYHLFIIGVAIMLGTAFLINSFGTSGMIPIKGLAVPFLSYGGSSLLASSIAIGLILSISRDAYTDKEKYEH